MPVEGGARHERRESKREGADSQRGAGAAVCRECTHLFNSGVVRRHLQVIALVHFTQCDGAGAIGLSLQDLPMPAVW